MKENKEIIEIHLSKDNQDFLKEISPLLDTPYDKLLISEITEILNFKIGDLINKSER